MATNITIKDRLETRDTGFRYPAEVTCLEIDVYDEKSLPGDYGRLPPDRVQYATTAEFRAIQVVSEFEPYPSIHDTAVRAMMHEIYGGTVYKLRSIQNMLSLGAKRDDVCHEIEKLIRELE